MAWVTAKDISRYQGSWQDTGEEIVVIKCGGGDDGLYYDSKCTEDYNGATAGGRSVGLYWFAGGGNPTAEAAFFCKGLQPYAEGDVPALDIESGKTWNPNAPGVDPVAWANGFIDYVESQGFAGGLLYMNLATLLAHDWSGPLSRWGLWLADWDISPDANIPTHYSYVMQQYSDGPVYDHDAWFGTIEQFKAYGYHAPQAVSAPVPAAVETPVDPPEVTPVEPATTTPSAPQTPEPQATTTTGTTADTSTTVTYDPPTPAAADSANSQSLFSWLAAIVSKVISFLKVWKR